jgi:NAD(P)-dependent dehydrogenase (short-subunit alcohol dehydrogenase family)
MSRRIILSNPLNRLAISPCCPYASFHLQIRQISTVDFQARASHQNHNSRRTNKVLITGGSKGIGLSIAHAFAQTPNHRVTILSRDLTRLEKACEEVWEGAHRNGSQEPSVNGVQADVTDPSIWTRKDLKMVGAGRHPDPSGQFKLDFDVLVNAAGISHSSLLSSMSIESINKIMDTNMMGTIYASRAISKAMIRMKHRDKTWEEEYGKPDYSPSIINISSLLGLRGGRGSSVYAASKAGVLGEYSHVLLCFDFSMKDETLM